MNPTYVQSNIDKNGREVIICCVSCRQDSRGICRGRQIHLINDHIKQTAVIYQYNRPLESFKGEILSMGEFVKWIETHGYTPVTGEECKKRMEEL
jgi:hypothetical protein